MIITHTIIYNSLYADATSVAIQVSGGAMKCCIDLLRKISVFRREELKYRENWLL